MANQPNRPLVADADIEQERYDMLAEVEEWLETPVIILGFIWLILLVIDLVHGLSPFLNTLVYLIWGIFVVDFGLRFILAPKKIEYLKSNWLTALSLAVPALRVFRIVRIAQVLAAAPGTSLVSIVGTANRGMRALRGTLHRRGFRYVLLLTLIVLLVGSAGIYAFEGTPNRPGVTPTTQSGINSYGEALWWTAMIMTTMGSDYWPQTGAGRLLTLLLALYSFGVFGYVTATLATFFIGRESEAVVEEASAQAAASETAAAGEIAAASEAAPASETAAAGEPAAEAPPAAAPGQLTQQGAPPAPVKAPASARQLPANPAGMIQTREMATARTILALTGEVQALRGEINALRQLIQENHAGSDGRSALQPGIPPKS